MARAEGLALRRGGRHLAGPLDLALRGGTLTALLGPSGAGKTTLGDTLLGLAPPAAGRLSWLGQGLDRRTRATLRPRFQKLHQDPTAVFPAGRPIGHSLRDLARLRPDSASRLPGLLERLGVAPALLERAPDAISGGEAQRLALARVLSLRPALLVADEPCSRLDPPTRRETLGLLRGLADQDGLAVLLVTHEGEAAAKLADHCVRMGGEREERQEGLRPS
ncbi:ATP-binding cassette domain-containing protein [Roseomonas sp. GC11]|nr:ATP-binding cassette domain-containing protein [Roseomonas sp. GC11]